MFLAGWPAAPPASEVIWTHGRRATRSETPHAPAQAEGPEGGLEATPPAVAGAWRRLLGHRRKGPSHGVLRSVDAVLRPRSPADAVWRRGWRAGRRLRAGFWLLVAHPRRPGHRGHRPPLRSEERRVGKECRSRWSQYH